MFAPRKNGIAGISLKPFTFPIPRSLRRSATCSERTRMPRSCSTAPPVPVLAKRRKFWTNLGYTHVENAGGYNDIQQRSK